MSNIISTKSNGIGLITLQRPEAINALSLDMVLNLTTTLMEWCADPDVKAVRFGDLQKKVSLVIFVLEAIFDFSIMQRFPGIEISIRFSPKSTNLII